ncbi:legume lectin beta domain protein [Methanocaldococcus sp. FS406-22]|uniref:lectin-like domain-containing protein n=1 Tax=Methanocaldococcus sp. (strain FS406-22) TaxID=644281 RepID=UPI0001C4E123|nr:right-handed parallel beta-helix repeat-containing protein [Methanocaldococcus sp. FS406-22]ADC68950.1 legume lectin beta domain protein [Methanocaldococcus sp. FS406-22]
MIFNLKNISIFVLAILLVSNVSLGLNISTINESLDSNNMDVAFNKSLPSSIDALNYNLTKNESVGKDNNVTINITNVTNEEENECYLNVIVNGYKVIVETNGKVFGFANGTPLKFVKIDSSKYVISPVILNTPMEIYTKFDGNKILHKTVILNYTKPEKENEETKKKELHYLNVSFDNFKLIVKTNGKPYAKYLDVNIKVKTKKIKKYEYLVYPLILNKTIIIYAKFKNETLNKTVFLNYTCENENLTNKTILTRDVYFPSEKIVVKTNFKPNTAYIITPDNKIIRLKVHKKGKFYVLSTKLKKNVILGNYSVVIDGIKKTFAVDYYKINAKLINNRFIVGNVSYYVKEPKFLTLIIYPNKKEIDVPLINGTFDIPLDYLVNKLNISKPEKIKKIVLICGNAEEKIKIKLKNKEKLKKLISYDPVNKEVVIKIEGNKKDVEKILKEYKKGKYYISKIMDINNHTTIEIRVKADEEILKDYGLPVDVIKTTETIKKISNNKIRVEVNNKLDGIWYRFSCKIPKGYRVKEIVGDDGRIIKNNISINRLTGEVVGEVRWYIENNTLYFYDDPIYGYDISLIPPAPNNSIAVELSYDGQDNGGCGQISAIVFPYSEGDNISTIETYDHAGRTGDYDYANNIDADAGSKIAIKYTSGIRTRQYGNGGDYYETASFYLSEINRTDVPLNTVPNGVLESVIITNMYAPWTNNELNITQKVIIRGNNKWFATIYYIKNPTTKTYTNLKFFQGMDWNFRGSYQKDNAYYNNANDVVYGYDSDAPSGDIQYGGFKSILPSYEHDVNPYWRMWDDIKYDNLNNYSSYNGDAGVALAWTKSSLKPGEIWVVPIIWGLGYNFTDMMNEINMGLSQLYDTGVKTINYPNNGDVFNPNLQPIIYVNSTIALYGLVDAYNLNVSINVTQINGTYTYTNSTLINLSVPYEEEKTISFPINISNMPYGAYNITIKTNLPNDQNTSNDEKSIIIYISPFSIEPEYQEKTGNAGEEIFYNITLYNFGSGERFDINITNSTKGWTTCIYNNSTLIAEDTNGDGIWDYISPNYDLNANNLPDIYVPHGELNLTVSKVIPPTTPLGEIDLTTLKFVNTNNPSIYDIASFQTSTPFPPSVQKTFYLHGDSSRTLNTSIPTEIDNYTTITGNSLASWTQIPRFADDFTVVGNISILLYMSDPDVLGGFETHKIVVSLIATNGVNSITLGSDTEDLNLYSTTRPYTFNIPLNSIVTIPKDYYLILRVENLQSTNSINIYHDSTYVSNITLNTTTYVEVQNIYADKDVYIPGDTATVFVNITDPIGSYDIKGANIAVYYPNGTLYINDSMNLQEVDANTPSLWKLFNYSFKVPVSGNYNITITGIESNGVIYKKDYVLCVGYEIQGYVKEDFGTLGVEDSSDKGVYDVNVSLFEDSNNNGVLDKNDKMINSTTTDVFGYYKFLVYNTSKTYFVAVNSKTISPTRGYNQGYNINDVWAEETYQTLYAPINTSQWIANGNATVSTNKLLLTPDDYNQVGSVWYYEPVNLSEDFVIEYYAYLGDNPDGADGVTFTLQPNGLSEWGGAGGGLGYAGITPSVAVEIDTWLNDFDYPATTDHIAIDVDGIVNHTYNNITFLTPNPYDLGNVEDGTEHKVKIVWNATTKQLTVYFDGSQVLTWNKDITQILGTTAYFGFTGGTGGAKNLQYIKPTYAKNGNSYIIKPTYSIVSMFGGRNPGKSDDWNTGDYEHYCTVDLNNYHGENITFGFSFDVITNTNPVGQGSFAQFIKNANAIVGEDKAYFKIPKTELHGKYYVIYTNNNSIVDNLTVINGSTQVDGDVLLSGSQWIANGDSYINNSENLTLIITPDDYNQVGSVWYYEPVNLSEDFVIEYYAYLGDNPDGADGVTFTLQPNGLSEWGGAGGGLGYAGITPSVAVEIDTWLNDFDYPATTDHIAIDVDGIVNHTYNNITFLTPNPYDLGNVEDGTEHKVKIVWNATTKQLTVYFDGSQVLTWNKDITQILGTTAYFGFTGGTGGAKNLQYIKPTYAKNGNELLNLDAISKNPVINNLAYNTTISNINFENVSVAILGNESGLNYLKITNVSVFGNILKAGIELLDYNWNMQEYPAYMTNIHINSSDAYGIEMLNRIWLIFEDSLIEMHNGIGVYWANWAGGYGNLTMENISIKECNHGIYFYKNGNIASIINSKIENSAYEGIYIIDSNNISILNTSIINNSIGIFSNNSSISVENSTVFNNRFEGIYVENSNITTYNLSVSNNSIGIYIKGFGNNKISLSRIFYNNYGVEVVNSSKILMNSSEIFNNSIDGIAVFNGDNLTITNNRIYNNNYSFLSYGNLTNVFIYNTSFENSTNKSLDIEVPSNSVLNNLTILDSKILNSGEYGLYVYSLGDSSNLNISGNFINASFRDGILIFGVNDIEILNNNITNNGLIGGDPAGAGIKVIGYNTANVTIENNNCSNNGGNGIDVEDYYGNYLRNVTIENNYLSNNGIEANAGNALFIGGRVENVLVKNNIMQYSDAQAILIQEPNGWATWAWIGTNITIDNNTIQYNGLTVEAGNVTAGITIGAYGNYNQDDGYIIIKNNKIINNNLCPNPSYGGKVGGIEIYGLNESWINLEFNITNNIIANNSAYGISVAASKDINIVNNTIYNNEKGITLPTYDSAPHNIIISKNSIYNNSMLGIDLNDDNVTLNDGLINPNEANYGIDYPIITYAELVGDNLTIRGYIGNGTGSSNFANAIVEIFLVKNSTGGDNLIGNNISSDGTTLDDTYGEGWIYLGSLIADSNGFFNGTLNVSGKGVDYDSILTATATINGYGTSEFGRNYLLIKKFFNITGSITMLPNGYNITIKSYNTTRDVYVYWYKPNDIGVINISGDYNENGTNGNTYWFKFNIINANEVKKISITTNTTTIEGLIIGIDPK